MSTLLIAGGVLLGFVALIALMTWVQVTFEPYHQGEDDDL